MSINSDILSEGSNIKDSKINVSERAQQELLAEIAYYRHKIDEQIAHGYHEAERATHEDGIYHQAFLETQAKLQSAIQKLLITYSILQKS